MTKPLIQVRGLAIGYDDNALMRNLSFDIARRDIFVIMGPSGCGKSTLMRTMTGLVAPLRGRVIINGSDLFRASADRRADIMKNIGVSFQGGALFSSMTVEENIALPLQQHTDFSATDIAAMVDEKLAMVGLENARDLYPSEISGGMKKRAGLARALALNPEIVFFDEPSAGLDPISSRGLDDLILTINQKLGTTIIIVSHELQSIFTIATSAIYLDTRTHTIGAYGDPRIMRDNPPDDVIGMFLNRGDK